MKLISSIFGSLKSDAWWNIDIKFHFRIEFFLKRENLWNLMIERFKISFRCWSVFFGISSGSAEGSPEKYFFGELANIFNEIFSLFFTLRPSSWPHNSDSRRFPFIPLLWNSKQHRWGSGTSNFYKFIVYYTLLKLLCLFIVFLSFFTTTAKGYKRKMKIRCFVCTTKKALQRLFFPSIITLLRLFLIIAF